MVANSPIKDPLLNEATAAKRRLSELEKNRDDLQKIYNAHTAEMADYSQWSAQQAKAHGVVDTSVHDEMLSSMIKVDAEMNEQLAAANKSIGQARLWLAQAITRANLRRMK